MRRVAALVVLGTTAQLSNGYAVSFLTKEEQGPHAADNAQLGVPFHEGHSWDGHALTYSPVQSLNSGNIKADDQRIQDIQRTLQRAEVAQNALHQDWKVVKPQKGTRQKDEHLYTISHPHARRDVVAATMQVHSTVNQGIQHMCQQAASGEKICCIELPGLCACLCIANCCRHVSSCGRETFARLHTEATSRAFRPFWSNSDHSRSQ